MSTLRLPGLLTGIDTTKLIEQLMAIERRSLNVYKERISIWEERQDALSTLETKLSNLRSSVRALSDADELRAFSVASSDTDKLTADASYNAFEGNHTVVINQLANAERWVHTTGKEYAEDYVGAGTFIYSYNNKETVLTTTSETTLEDFVGLINNDANNPGITASLLYYNDAYHLVLNGNDVGTDYGISINASSTEVWQANIAFTVGGGNATLSSKITGLDQFGANPLLGGEHIEITGFDHDGVAIAQVDLPVTENTKVGHLISEINDAFDGIAKAVLENGKIILTDDTSGTSSLSIDLRWDNNSQVPPATLTLPTMAFSTEGGSTTASGLNDNFEPADFSETQSAQDSEIRVDGYPPGAWISRSSNTVDDVIYGVALHLHDTTDANGEELTLTRDIQSVKDKLTKMVDAYNFAVQYIKEKTGYNDVLKTAGLLMGDYVVSTIRQQIRTPLIVQTNGFIEDIDTFLTPGHIGFKLDREGVLSLDMNVLDEAIAEDYMSVLAIIGADKTGSSDSNTIEFYGAHSDYTTAGSYDVEVVVSGGAITSAKIKLSTESTYRDATYSGNIITGNSTFDDNGNPMYPENALQLSVDLSQDGTFTATVRVKQGFTGAIEDALDNMLKVTTGSIQIDQKHVDNQIEYLQEKIENEEYRLTKREERLIARFSRLERNIALIQQQMGALGFAL
ncbi:MAG TPA: flagellar filament capping protein FliD [Sedimentisphaerales bacterium]|nr:flagellar filament capping protein FliD [Sedimentisphaerales bacterium]